MSKQMVEPASNGSMAGNEKRRIDVDLAKLIDDMKRLHHVKTDAEATAHIARLFRNAYSGGESFLHPVMVDFGIVERRLRVFEQEDYAELQGLLAALFQHGHRDMERRVKSVAIVRDALRAAIQVHKDGLVVKP